MENTPQNLIDDDTAIQGILSSLKASIQEDMGREMRVVRLLELTPIMSEVTLQDPSSGTQYFARVYRVPPSKHPMVQQLWREHATTLHAAFKHLPQKAQGLKTIGKALAYVAADVPGMDLETYLRLVGPLRPEMAIRLCVQMTRVLEKLAELNCHHYQIHPGNITITPEGVPVLKWVGLSQFENALAEAMQVPELIDATYATPEQLEGEAPTLSTDIYQLGLVLFRMVAGRPPYQGDFAAVKEGHKSKPLPNPKATNKAVTNGLNRVLMMALAKDPKQRFPSLKEMKTALGYLQPSVERAETTGATDSKALKLKEKDKAKIAQLLKESQEQAGQKDFQAALRTLDNVFVLVGWHGEAARLHQQIWEAMYGATVKKYYSEALKRRESGNASGALAAVSFCLALMPRFKQGLTMQAELFSALEDHAPVLPGAIDPGAYLGKAVEVKGDNPPLAEGLWSQVLLIAQPEAEEARSQLKFQKQLAARGIKGLQEELAAAEAAEASSPLNIPVPEAQPVPDSGFGDDFDDIFDSESGASPPPPAKGPDPTSAATPPPPVPTPPATDQIISEARSESPTEVPAVAPVPAAPAKPKKKLPLPAIIGVAAVILIVAVVGIVMKMRADQAAWEAAASTAYTAADAKEAEGEWEVALGLWDRAVADYPEYQDVKDRQESLHVRVRKRKHEIGVRLDSAKALLEAGMVYEPDDNGKNALELLLEVLHLEEDHAEAQDLLERIRTTELARANELYDAKNVPEAQGIYQRLTKADNMFRDEELENKLSTWVEENLVAPELAKMDRAIARKRWADAREIGDNLAEQMRDPARVQERWDRLWITYQEKYLTAKQKNKPNQELAALDVMVLIRPDDMNLADRRDKLNRDLNLAKITDLERKLAASRGKDPLATARVAKSLLSLDSKNEKATNALSIIRNDINKDINAVKGRNARAALKLYDKLLKVSNWKSYRKARAALAERVGQFDAGASRLEKDKGEPYAKGITGIDAFVKKYPDLSEDARYKKLLTRKTQMADEESRLQTLVKWELKNSDNMGATYAAMIGHLNKNNNFQFKYGKQKVTEFIKKYREKEDNYDSTVKVVIVGASSLPIKKGGLRKTGTYCELVTGGQSFKTEEIKGNNPRYNQICTFTAKPGAPLVFTVYETARRKSKPIGTITLSKVPKDKKNFVLKPSSGDWTLTINVDRER